MLTNAQRTHSEFGQSIWYDNVRKSALDNGEFARLISSGVRGCTSNPSIFNKSIAGSSDYDSVLARLVGEGHSVEEIYEQLAVDDIQKAADQLRSVFEESNGADGHVSIEVMPRLAHDLDATVKEALHLVERVGRKNLMIKVPATDAGLMAITELIGKGVSINVTLIFSRRRYVEVAEAYIAGLEKARQAGIDLSSIASVASFFVSRIDSAVDKWLSEQSAAPGKPDPKALLGKIAIANAKVAYEEYEQLFSSERFSKLRAAGARPQRLLWASTSTKNPDYQDTLYVDELVGRDTVNTVPPATLTAYQDHGQPKDALGTGRDEARKQLDALAELGLDLEEVCAKLLSDGVDAFIVAMDELLQSIGKRREGLQSAQSAT
jgi:transaldolase